MKAIICEEFGSIDALVVADVPEPVPDKDEVLIEIAAAGVNFPDGLIARGEYQVKPPCPFTLGSKVAGVVVGIGSAVRSFSIGDRVAALCLLGGFAQKVAVKASRVISVPDEVDLKTAAAFMIVYGTSIHGLLDGANLRPGETLLVLDAAGGVGLAAVEIGKAVGACVVAAASTAEKLRLARAHGADICINYSERNLREEIKRIAPDGIDVAYDPVGGSFTEIAIRCLGWRGRLLVIGFASGGITKLPTNLLLLKEAQAIGVNWGPSTQRDPAQHANNMSRLMTWLREGKLRPHIGATYDLEETAEALNAVMERRSQGKVVVVPRH